ncbi:MAG: 23S rRNA (pseudouridine(1915)-N(3))-methyltransferase RlmH [Terracidiphilus sp.]|jgi:23S rRNA (pseudouridine1915-N3)-methyltransferase
MQVTLAHIGAQSRSRDLYEKPIRDYLKRCVGVARCTSQAFRTESVFLDWLSRQSGRTEPALLLMDGRGRLMSSEALADWLGGRRNGGTQHVVFAIGPADGWSEEARAEGKRRGGLLSLGPMTLAHQLARLVMAEQLYRACTILTGHPYHKGH